MVAKDYFQQRSMESNKTGRYKRRNKKKKIQMDWSHIKKTERHQRLPYFGTLRETGREEDREIAGEDR
jgi:hypothetical protein